MNKKNIHNFFYVAAMIMIFTSTGSSHSVSQWITNLMFLIGLILLVVSIVLQYRLGKSKKIEKNVWRQVCITLLSIGIFILLLYSLILLRALNV